MTPGDILTADDAAAWREQATGCVVFTNGVFDIVHPGHVHVLTEAKRLGDWLLVGVNDDASAPALDKGRGRPINPARARAAVVAALRPVDAVILFPEPTPEDLIRRLQPDILVKGSDYAGQELPGQATVEAAGGKVVLIPVLDDHSSTHIIERIRDQS